MTEPKWCSIDGSEWSIVIGDITATVWLLGDEETYCANIRLSNKDSIYADEFDCIKKAKAACIEVIEDHLDVKDAEAVLAEPSEEFELELQCPRCAHILIYRGLNAPRDACKPLWAVVAEDADDDCWRRNRGAFRQVRYYLFLNRQDAEDHKVDGFKVVPVWGE